MSFDFLDTIISKMPEYADGVGVNLHETLTNSCLDNKVSVGVALAAAYAIKSRFIVDTIRNSNVLTKEEVEAVMKAASYMGMTNVWYPFTEMVDDKEMDEEPKFHTNHFMKYSGFDGRQFEIFELAASIVGKCEKCVHYHYNQLKNNKKVSVKELKDVGRICSVIVGTAMALSIE